MQLESVLTKQVGTWYLNPTDPEAIGSWRLRQDGNDMVKEQKVAIDTWEVEERTDSKI